MSSDVTKNVKRFILNFTIAGISATVAKSITAPTDRIKLILQNQDSSLQVLKGERPRYNGIIDCLIRIPKEQGFFSFWRGNGTNILRYFPTQALNFAFFDMFTKNIQSVINPDTNLKSVIILFLSGGLAGGFTVAITFPLDLCQTRIAVDVGESASSSVKVQREFYGLGDCVKKIRRNDGIAGLYRGFLFGAVGVALYRAIYFGAFSYMKLAWIQRSAADRNSKPPILLGLLFAQIASVSSGLMVYPLDTIARRMMLDSGRPKDLQQFKSSGHVAKVLYEQGGIMAFYKGALVNCIRGLSGALVLVLYDEVMHRIDWKAWLNT